MHLFDAHGEYLPPEEFLRPYLDALEPREGSDELHFKDVERARYRGEVSYLDHELGRLLSLPRFERGVVAFTADHGESLGAHGIDFNHAELYPDTTAV
ncbi:hypothetical protein, partial [Streptococcus pseudopneumoniae]|uniref:hypothetical protein n=1 Tax=Streptococcus pseudopneumoniae TaxID=257758 RepID=UPI001BB22672